MILDIAIDGRIGYFLNGSNTDGILKLKGYDTYSYMFLGWSIDENDGDCNYENIYDYLIENKNLTYNIEDDCTIRAVYQKRREYIIRMADDNYNSSFVVEYMGDKITLQEGKHITALEGHDVKVSCIPNDVRPYNFVKWEDGHLNPYRVFNIGGDDLIVSLKAYCSLNENDDIPFGDNIDASLLNNFKTIYPHIKDSIFVDQYYINNIYISNCEVDILNDIPYVRIVDNGYIQILNINERGNFKLSLNNKGGDCRLFIDNYEVLSSAVDNNEFIFEFDGGIMTLTGNDSCIFGLNISKEVIYNKGKCMLCLSSEESLKLHVGEIVAEGGVIVNGNPYGISPVKFANVTNLAPLIIK